MKILAVLLLVALACRTPVEPAPVWVWQVSASAGQLQAFSRVPGDSAHSVTVWLLGRDSILTFYDEDGDTPRRYPEAERILRQWVKQ